MGKTVSLDLPHSYAYVAAFERNCPNVRLTKDERQELGRLMDVLAESQRTKVPAGYAIVPVEPTEKMMAEGAEARIKRGATLRGIWSAMLSASGEEKS